jgi:tetratricopeptide (TPR) repeat protein
MAGSRDTTRAIAILTHILEEFPRDIVALKLVQFLLFYSGDSARMQATVAAALPAWDESVPAYGFALGCHAFGLEESGEYDAAERAGRRAVALNPDDIWGAHAVAHVFEMQDRVAEGLGWIDALAPHWRAANNFAFHVWWHRCLYLLALRRFDEVLERYDREVRTDSTDDYLDVTNAISLLWRLEQRGVAVGHRWNELIERAAQRRDDHITVFADTHYAIALAASEPDAAAGWDQSARAYATQSRETQAAIMDEVGLALGTAAIAHRRGDFSAALDRLLPLRAAIHRIGGSHAQRDPFAELLIDAAVKAGRHDVARDLLRERLAARPRNAWSRREIGLLVAG